MIVSRRHKNQVAVQLLGGLGNQMFQFAAGFALARRLGAELHLDLSSYARSDLREYALEPFGIEAVLHQAEVRTGLWHRLRRLMGKKRALAWWHGAVYREKHFQFDADFAQLQADTLLMGYFQSERYFAGAADEVAALFNPLKLASAEAIALATALAGEGSVAIHIRRGDYVSNPAATAFHGVLGDAYYDRAVEAIREHVKNPRFFIFSDDPAAAKALAVRVQGAQAMRGASAGDDLYLMACARHHVIANSSFSWWSAWLDRRAGGVRIAPRQWFSPHVAHDTSDLCPPDWIRL
jgi:Glycosyl transferase family 11